MLVGNCALGVIRLPLRLSVPLQDPKTEASKNDPATALGKRREYWEVPFVCPFLGGGQNVLLAMMTNDEVPCFF